MLWVLVCIAVAAVGAELCPEYASFLRANDLRCQHAPPPCTSNADCAFTPSDRCYTALCVEGACAFGYNDTCIHDDPSQQQQQPLSVSVSVLGHGHLSALNYRVLAVNNTAQCHGYNADTQHCFTGLCSQGACHELLDRPVANTFPCDCEARRYLECFSDADCAPLVAGQPPACVSAQCSVTSGFCDVRVPLPPVPAGCCTSDAGCDDGNHCTVDVCGAGGTCVHTPNNATVGCCSTTTDCRGPPSDRPRCPASVCAQGECLLTAAAPVCSGLERCRADRFSYCAVDTTVLAGGTTLVCVGSPELTPQRSCLMNYGNNRCSYGTCTPDGGVVPCVAQPALNNTLFACDCVCGEPVTEQQQCGVAGTEFAFQCVPFGQGGTPPSGGGSSDEAFRDSLNWALLGVVLGVCVLPPLGLLIYAGVQHCRARRLQRRSGALAKRI